MFKKRYLKQAIAFLSCLCFLLSSYPSTPLFADLCRYTNEEEPDNRTKTAYVVAGLTVVALVGGIACLANASGHHRHHSSSSCSSYSSYSPYYRYASSYSHYSYDRSYDYSDSYSSYRSRSKDYRDDRSSRKSNFSDSDGSFRPSVPQMNTRLTHEMRPNKEDDQMISGLLVSNPDLAQRQGNLTAFVQLPDGSTRSLGTLPISGHRGGSLSFGPFNQKGTYLFGVNLDQGSSSALQTTIGTLEINVNGSKKQRHEFVVPPHAPANYEPLPCCFDLN